MSVHPSVCALSPCTVLSGCGLPGLGAGPLRGKEPSLSVQVSSVSQSCPTLCNPMDCSTSGFPVHHQLLELAQTHVCWVGDAIQPSHPLSSPSPRTFNLPRIRVFSNESVLCIKWPKYWSFSFSISLSNEYSGLISFRMDWLDLLAVQGTLKRLLQHHSSKASILRCSAFFMVYHGCLIFSGCSLISTTAPACVLQVPSEHQWAVQPFPRMVLKWYRTVH